MRQIKNKQQNGRFKPNHNNYIKCKCQIRDRDDKMVKNARPSFTLLINAKNAYRLNIKGWIKMHHATGSIRKLV